MKINTVIGSVASVELSSDEIGMINNALNEVCNGVGFDGEFDTRMGCTIERARRLLSEVNQLCESIDTLN